MSGSRTALQRLRGLPFKGDRVTWESVGETDVYVALATVVRVSGGGTVCLRVDTDPRTIDDLRLRLNPRHVNVRPWSAYVRNGWRVLRSATDHRMSPKLDRRMFPLHRRRRFRRTQDSALRRRSLDGQRAHHSREGLT